LRQSAAERILAVLREFLRQHPETLRIAIAGKNGRWLLAAKE